MSPDGTFIDSLGVSEWHTIRPGKPPLSLSVREITSVSVTFILSSTFSDFTAEAEPFLASLGLAAEDDNEEDDGDDETDDSVSAEQKKLSVISEVLAKGLSVNVNSATWKGVYIRIDDKTDEAVIIIYGLMPGKKYDIDLGLVQGGQSNNIRRQVITDDLEMPSPTSLPEADTVPESPLPTPSTSPSRTMATTPPVTAPHPQLTLEDRLNQLQHTLSLIALERDTLSVSLKTARRDAQKADAALRSEIEILKRASEKHTVAEHRARQKVLALQEAAKRAQLSTREMEELVLEVDAELPALKSQRAVKEDAYSTVKENADRVRTEREREAERERRKLDLMRGELTGLNNKMERLTGKREKLETGVLPDLEEQLREIELEIERVEADPLGYAYSEDAPDELDETEQFVGYNHGQWRQQTPGLLTRPSPIPIQRPGLTSSASASNFPQWTAVPRYQPPPLLPNTNANTSQHQRSSSSRAPRSPVPFVQALPQRHSSLKSTLTSSSDSSSLNSSPTATPAVANTSSTLSSRAAPFEPGRMRPPAAAYAPNQWPTPGAAVRGNSTHKWAGS
ncbi:hypothetical protein C8F04DRAFT_996125 [Mycena alexandri]|uniref:Uncharacterized protein n=1 Tax=Mycena alexandri TaxID=1745969 RepID=A0AAD6T4Q4_9AGAR|nr:hypothetical protein C8F04DRAFT_996125 [Mycena alexandri]